MLFARFFIFLHHYNNISWLKIILNCYSHSNTILDKICQLIFDQNKVLFINFDVIFTKNIKLQLSLYSCLKFSTHQHNETKVLVLSIQLNHDAGIFLLVRKSTLRTLFQHSPYKWPIIICKKKKWFCSTKIRNVHVWNIIKSNERKKYNTPL